MNVLRFISFSNKYLTFYLIFYASIILLSLFSSPPIKAHPGNTASDGGHYCRTNCEKWGEVYGERHFHGGSVEDDDSGYEDYYDDPPEPDYDDLYSSPDPEDYSSPSQTSTASSTEPESKSKEDKEVDYTGFWVVGSLATVATGAWLISNKDNW